MNTEKNNPATGQSSEKKEPTTAETNQKDTSPDYKSNPNPRANENIPDSPTDNSNDQEGVGSEITDGEDG